MTGPEHYREAELLAAKCKQATSFEAMTAYAERATAHATLALAAATAMGVAVDGEPESGLPHADAEAWYAAVGTKAVPRGETR
jgi:hypothetical protein